MNELRISEIFHSLQGEADTVGWPTVFVRLTGCPLRCVYCDTAYAFKGGELLSIDSILGTVAAHKAHYVTVTGGEPLAQPNCLPLMTGLCDTGYRVSLETSGAMPINAVDPRVNIVMDIKTPASAESHRNDLNNLSCLKPDDQLKFVICDRADYDWSVDFIREHALTGKHPILFSPSYQQLPPADLADWILADKLNVRFQMQLHKSIWGDDPGR